MQYYSFTARALPDAFTFHNSSDFLIHNDAHLNSEKNRFLDHNEACSEVAEVPTPQIDYWRVFKFVYL